MSEQNEIVDESLELDDAAFSMEEDESSGFRYGAVIGIVLAAVLVGFMIFDGMEAETYFYTVDEAVAQGDDLIGQTVRIKGTVEPGTIVGEDGELGRTFNVTEKGKSIKVTYNKAMPDTFDEDMEVVVQGKVDDDMMVVADEVLVKCPSRYEGAPPTAMPKSGEQAAL